MPRTSFAEVTCSLARTLEVIGDQWTPLILRDVCIGITRFDAIQRNLGLSRKVLSQRLDTMVEDGLLERVAYQEHPPRYDYVVTEKGADLALVLVTMMGWGDKWVFGEQGPPVVWRHERCGEFTTPQVTCSCCGEPLRAGEAVPFLGPGADLREQMAEIPAAFDRLHELMGVAPGTAPPHACG